MVNRLAVLLIDDTPDDRILIIQELRQEFPGVEVQQVADAKGFAQALAEGDVDVVITDHQLRWTDGLAVLRAVKSRWLDCPVIMFTGTDGEEIAVEAMKNGLDDYVIKSPRHFMRLRAAVRSALERTQQCRAAREAEAWYRSLFDGVPVGLYRSTLGGLFFDVNEALVAMMGYPDKQSLMGVNARNLYVDPSDRERWLEILGKEGIVRDFEVKARRYDGTQIWFRHSARTVRDEGGRVLYIEGSAEDVTGRRQAEEQVQRQLEALRLLIASAQNLVRSQDIETCTQEVCRAVLSAFSVYLVWLGRAEPDGRVRVLQCAGEGVDYLKQVEVRWDKSPLGQGPSGRAIRSGRPVVVCDIQTDPSFAPWREIAVASGQHSVASFPLLWGAESFGVLNVCSDRPDFFTPDRMDLLQTCANIVAGSLKNAELIEKTQRHVQRLAALRSVDRAISGSLDLRVASSIILDQVTIQLGVDAATMLLNRETQRLEYAGGRGFRTNAITRSRLRVGEGHAGRAALERRTITIPNLAETGGGFVRGALLAGEDFVAYCAVPPVAKGQLKGVLEVFSRSPIYPDAEWLEFLDAFAAQAAIAIDNAKLFEDLQRSNLEMIVAFDTTIEGLSRGLDLRDQSTEGHAQRVVEMSLHLARALGLSDNDLVHIRRGALLHDIGKMAIPDSILLKASSLTEEEWAIMRRHPAIAYELLSHVAHLRPALDIPYCHHEKWNGTGYPRGLKGEEIPLSARIFAVANVWDSLRCERPYRGAWPIEKVREHIAGLAGTDLDPSVVEIFMRLDDASVTTR